MPLFCLPGCEGGGWLRLGPSALGAAGALASRGRSCGSGGVAWRPQLEVARLPHQQLVRTYFVRDPSRACNLVAISEPKVAPPRPYGELRANAPLSPAGKPEPLQRARCRAQCKPECYNPSRRPVSRHEANRPLQRGTKQPLCDKPAWRSGSVRGQSSLPGHVDGITPSGWRQGAWEWGAVTRGRGGGAERPKTRPSRQKRKGRLVCLVSHLRGPRRG